MVSRTGGRVVRIFVGQSTKPVSELMHYNRFEHRMVGGGQRIGIIDASSSVCVRVGQYDDVLVRDAGQPVVDGLYAAGRAVTVGMHCVES